MDDLVFTKRLDGYQYNRNTSLSLEKLRDICMEHYNVKECVISPSGMCAISTLINGILAFHLKDRINIIHGNELYCDTPRLFDNLRQMHSEKLTVWEAAEDITGIIRDRFQGEINILFIESCTNPNGYIFDYSIVDDLRKLSHKLYLIVDNTWLTNVIFNPFDYGADFVVSSLSKYPSSGACIGGVILSNNTDIMNKVFDHVRINGIHVSPFHCELIYKNIQNMEERIIKSSELTKKIIEYLQTIKKIDSISHPMILSHPSNHLAQRYFKLYPSVLTFQVSFSKNMVLKKMKTSNYIDFKTSFGSANSRFDPWPYKTGNRVVCRLSIGYDDTYENIINGINQFIN